jgi:phage terminase large subunit-like protein
VSFDFSPCVADPWLKELGIHRDIYLYNFSEISRELLSLTKKAQETRKLDIIRSIAPDDLFFLLYFVLDIREVNQPFVVARIYEVQERWHRCLDLWARGHYKSTIKTFALPIWWLIKNPDERISIFSNTRALAIGHMRRIKTTLETNELLLHAFPERFYERPMVQAEKWSEEVGLFCRRKKVYTEASIEANGLVDYLPTGRHYTKLIYDDVIDARNVGTQAQIEKASRFFKLSLNLVSDKHEEGISGTRYSLKDIYSEIMKKKKWETRLYAAEVDDKGHGKRGGTPVMMSRDDLDDKFDTMGEWIYNAQMLQNPVAESEQRFNPSWLKFWTNKTRKPPLYYYILVDPATKKKKESDYTVMAVIGTDALRNYWLIDMVRDKLDLLERWKALKKLVTDYGCTEVGYEQYGMQADIEFMHRMMEEEGVHFHIIDLGGQVAKDDRIKKLVPDFQRGRWVIPDCLMYTTVEKETIDVILAFLDEYKTWVPGRSVGHDDMLDDLARIYESKLNVIFPVAVLKLEREPYRMNPLEDNLQQGSWMSEG